MKKFLLSIITLFVCVVCYGATFNQYWYVEDNTPIQTSCTTGGDIILPTPPTKYGYDFIGWEQVPFTRIEYLESTGTQWITFGKFYPDRKYETIIDSVHGTFGVNRSYWTGVYNNWSYGGIAVNNSGIPNNVRQLIYYYYTPNVSNNTTTITLTDKTISSSNTFGIQNDTNGWKFGLFCLTNSAPSFYTAGKVYSIRIFENDIMIYDFIPVLDKNLTPCMFDKVEGKFYYNAGTGQFIAGPVIGE